MNIAALPNGQPVAVRDEARRDSSTPAPGAPDVARTAHLRTEGGKGEFGRGYALEAALGDQRGQHESKRERGAP